MALAEQAKIVALKIQEALRGAAPVLFDDALELAHELVDKHGINKVATVEGLKAVASEELKDLADEAINSGVNAAAAKIEGAGGKSADALRGQKDATTDKVTPAAPSAPGTVAPPLAPTPEASSQTEGNPAAEPQKAE